MITYRRVVSLSTIGGRGRGREQKKNTGRCVSISGVLCDSEFDILNIRRDDSKI